MTTDLRLRRVGGLPTLHNAGTSRPGGWWGSLGLGLLSLGTMVTVTLLAFLALIGAGTSSPDTAVLQDPYFWRTVRFTLLQASLSAVLSVGLAIPVARAIALDRRLPGKALFLRWSLLCFVMPSLVLITGIVSVFGRSGWLSPWLGESWSLYGLNGILLAHVFMNLPLAVRVLVQQWQGIPDNTWKVAAQLGLTGLQRFRVVELPALRGVLPGITGFIFLLCFNSFAVVLALGGGPQAATLEVAIYQALKFQFNPAEALVLAWAQFLIAGSLYWLFSRWGRLEWLGHPSVQRGWSPRVGPGAEWLGRVGYGATVLFLTVPIATLVPVALSEGGQGFPWSRLLQVSMNSLLLATGAATLAVLLALAALNLWRRLNPGWCRAAVETAVLHHLILPGMVLSVGIYLFFLPVLNWLTWGWVAIIVLNALIALPFVVHQLRPRWHALETSYRRLAADLGLSGWRYGYQVVWPWLAPVVRRAWALSFVIALGDFAVFAIYGSENWNTLPWLIYSLSGAYRMQAAALASLCLLGLALLALWWLEKDNARTG